jgi:DNA-binding GntR family transcriptional regulator
MSGAKRRRKPDVAPAEGGHRDRTLPRYLEIKAALVADIKTGTSPIGSLLPTEHELCRRFNVSRFTVRQALKGLQDAGLIERRSGVGSMVIAEERQETFVHSLTSLTELLRYPYQTYRTDLSRQLIKASPEQAHLLLCSPGEEWVRVQGVRIARGSKFPFSWVDIFVRPQFQHVFDLPNPKGEPVYRQIERQLNHQIRRAHVEIFAGQITSELSGPMQIEEGTPALNIIRRYSGGDGAIFLVTYTVHPANRFVFTMDLERKWEPSAALTPSGPARPGRRPDPGPTRRAKQRR